MGYPGGRAESRALMDRARHFCDASRRIIEQSRVCALHAETIVNTSRMLIAEIPALIEKCRSTIRHKS